MENKFQINKPVFVVKEKVKGIVKGFKDGKVIVTYFPRNSSNRQVEHLDPTELRPYRNNRKNNKRTVRPKRIYIKYFTDIEKIQKIKIGDWIDLRAAEDVTLKQGEFKLIPLGVAMKLPRGYEANIVPRSSTFANWGIIQTNSIGVVDNSYCGPNDQWFFPAYATRDTVIKKNDRICQFRINRVMGDVEFIEVEELKGKDRGGHGSTGQA